MLSKEESLKLRKHLDYLHEVSLNIENKTREVDLEIFEIGALIIQIPELSHEFKKHRLLLIEYLIFLNEQKRDVGKEIKKTKRGELNIENIICDSTSL